MIRCPDDSSRTSDHPEANPIPDSTSPASAGRAARFDDSARATTASAPGVSPARRGGTPRRRRFDRVEAVEGMAAGQEQVDQAAEGVDVVAQGAGLAGEALGLA